MLKVFLLLAITLASAAALASASASGSLCQGALTSQLDNYAAAQKALNMANRQESMVQNLILGDPASPCKICKIVKEGRASDTQSLQKYGQDQVWLAAPGVAFCGLTVILLIFFLLARCCCATCCCTSETMVEEMGCCDTWAPVIFYFLFGGAVLGVSVFGTTKIGGFANALIGMVCQAERLGADAKGFIDSIADPVQNVATLATTQINKVEGVMNSTSNIEGALNEVVAQFGEFVAGVSAIRFNNTVPAFVATVSAEGSSALTSIRSITDPAISVSLDPSSTSLSCRLCCWDSCTAMQSGKLTGSMACRDWLQPGTRSTRSSSESRPCLQAFRPWPTRRPSRPRRRLTRT